MVHVPVLQKEALRYLDPKPNENFIDCTFGQGGHALFILEKNGPKGILLGIEIDSELYKESRNLKSKRLILVQGSYVNLKEIAREAKIRLISGILFDLGISSWHLSESKRGFSFLRKERLDMRYSTLNHLTAEKILNFWSKNDIKRILREHGEERYAQSIAENIIESRKIEPIQTTFQLVEIIRKAVPRNYLKGHIHFATRTFQALRITVNDELHNLEKTLPQALEILKRNGKLVVISFHSLEDRIVKNFLREKAKEGSLIILTKKPIRPSFEETKTNPRSRSAKLRAAIKIR